VSEQFSAPASSAERELLVRERLFWSIHVASNSWPWYLRSEKASVTTKTKLSKLKKEATPQVSAWEDAVAYGNAGIVRLP
jgi:hypothetical protein